MLVNLVANNFTLNGLDKRVLARLKCLQKNFPCNRGKGIYSEFLINKNGPSTSFYVSDVERWAVSSVGIYNGGSNIVRINNTLDSELFQSARHSSSSLRYYGLGLENGGYTVTLQFAEIVNNGFYSWKGLGTRRFDIYVQGRLVEKDFDIRRTSGDTTLRSVYREYKTNVSENYLEIHLFWAGKESLYFPIVGNYGPLISTVSAKPDFTPTVDNKPPLKQNTRTDFTPTVDNRPPSKQNNRTGTVTGVIVGLGLLGLFAGAVIFIIRKSSKGYTDDEELLNMDVKPYTFTYSELKSATQDFDPLNKLGEGGFGSVYKSSSEKLRTDGERSSDTSDVECSSVHSDEPRSSEFTDGQWSSEYTDGHISVGIYRRTRFVGMHRGTLYVGSVRGTFSVGT
ncbi:hypothetical protein F2Q69_00046588 [Brassica cretica]|uniref:non-specific serine/threonine protein kinase n=1 Tax=Brassica cretica TaxID=69181 RepID=A0A8S9PNE9_BRACR|nr:hypothetical protein F2Q69_00046588 [Brassica cretica]